jgi:hypothetical protein
LVNLPQCALFHEGQIMFTTSSDQRLETFEETSSVFLAPHETAKTFVIN